MKNNNTAKRVSHLCARLMIAGVIFLTASCSSNKPEPRTQHIKIELQTANDINPDNKGKANPVHVTVWQLTATDAFMSSDYFSLVDGSDDEVKAQAQKRFDVIMTPNETREVTLDIPASVTAIGVVSAWRKINDSEWKAVAAIPQEPRKRWYQKLWPTKNNWQAQLRVEMKNLTTSIEKVD